MIRKKILEPDRVRRINGGFSFIPHRFVSDGFLTSLSQEELLTVFLFIPMILFAPCFKSQPTNISMPGTA